MRRTLTWILALLFITEIVSTANAQTNPGDYALTYGVNYASWDRARTTPPTFAVPGQFAYRPACWINFAVDDDSFVRNGASDTSSAASGTGNAAVEIHDTFWVSKTHPPDAGNCPAKTNPSLTADYVGGIPIGNLEATHPTHQLRATYVRPTALDQLTATGGVTFAGEADAGGTTYSRSYLLNVNYLRAPSTDSSWAGEIELDLQSATATAPFSATTILAVDLTLGAAQNVQLRAGVAFGLTSEAPRYAPFVQVTYLGNIK